MPFGIVNEPSKEEEEIFFELKDDDDTSEFKLPKKKRNYTPRSPKNAFDIESIDLNDFVKWVLELDVDEFPACSAIIKRAQRYRRTGFLKDCVELFKLYIKKKKEADNI